MTLSEIENILTDLRKRHTNLDKELLTTILTASGWEDKVVRDALALFAQQERKREARDLSTVSESIKKESTLGVDSLPQDKSQVGTDSVKEPASESKTSISTFVETNTLVSTEKIVTTTVLEKSSIAKTVEADGDKRETEHPTPATAVIPPVKKGDLEPQEEERKSSIHTEAQETHAIMPERVVVETPSLTQTKDPESLIVQKEDVAVRKVSDHIPEDLPLLPFESSPHVWSFSRYKDVFHGEVMPKKEEKVVPIPPPAPVVVPLSPPAPIPLYQSPVIPTFVQTKPQVILAEDEDVSLEKVPMTKGDESLVFLAGVMLLGIILILGYMYSNGRL